MTTNEPKLDNLVTSLEPNIFLQAEKKLKLENFIKYFKFYIKIIDKNGNDVTEKVTENLSKILEKYGQLDEKFFFYTELEQVDKSIKGMEPEKSIPGDEKIVFKDSEIMKLSLTDPEDSSLIYQGSTTKITYAKAKPTLESFLKLQSKEDILLELNKPTYTNKERKNYAKSFRTFGDLYFPNIYDFIVENKLDWLVKYEPYIFINQNRTWVAEFFPEIMMKYAYNYMVQNYPLYVINYKKLHPFKSFLCKIGFY